MTNDVLNVTSYAPVQNLYEAAKSCDPDRIRAAVDELERVTQCRDERAIAIARELYAHNEDTEIDDSTFTSPTSDGCWVMGWFWVPMDNLQSA